MVREMRGEENEKEGGKKWRKRKEEKGGEMWFCGGVL